MVSKTQNHSGGRQRKTSRTRASGDIRSSKTDWARWEYGELCTKIASQMAQNIPVPAIRRTCAALSAMGVVLHGAGFDLTIKKNVSSFSEMIRESLLLAVTDQLESTLKKDLTTLRGRYLMEKISPNDLTSDISWGGQNFETVNTQEPKKFVLLKGRIAFFLKRLSARAYRGNNKAASVLESFVETKRCWLALSKNKKHDSMVQHRETLSATSVPLSGEADFFIRMAANIVVPPGTLYQPGRVVPTRSGCLENKQLFGGGHQEFSINEPIDFGCPGARIDELSRKQEKLCLSRVGARNEAKFCAVANPGKWRSLTVMSGASNTAVRGLQKQLLSLWKRQPMSTMVDDVDDRIQKRVMARLAPGEYLISGDYDQATDWITRDATLTALEQVCSNLKNMDKEIEECAFRSLAQTFIRYPDKVEINSLERGQLMGHALSFPLLCIINLSTFLRARFATDAARENVIINGDDILFTGDGAMYDRWVASAGEVGLKTNVLKTYISTRYGLVNSRLHSKANHVGYLNWALAIGHNVSGEPKRLLLNSARIWDDLGQSPILANKARRVFLASLAAQLRKCCRGYVPNLFLHKRFGGLGLSNDGRDFYVTRDQRAVATAFLQDPTQAFITELLGERSDASIEALKAFKKVRPVCVPYMIGKDHVQGPLNEFEDAEAVCKLYLDRAMAATAYKINFEGEPDVGIKNPNLYYFRTCVKQAKKEV